MEETRYWKKIAEGGGFWSYCKDQENTKSNDGRQLYKYTRPNPGERWQYEAHQFGGVIDSLYIKDGKFGEELCIGVASENRVNVLQIKVWQDKKSDGKLHADFKGFAKKIPNIDINDSIDFKTWTNLKGTREWTDGEGNAHSSIPTHIMVYQDNGAMRTNTKAAFDYIDGAYVGIPAPESAEMGGRTVYDFTIQNKFFVDLVESFSAKNDELLKERRENRESTPAEALPNSSPVENELVAAGVDDDLPFQVRHTKRLAPRYGAYFIMDKYKRGTIVKIERSEKRQCDLLWLQRTNKSLFVVLEYRTEPNHKEGDTPNIPITGQEEDCISLKNGKSYTCYTTEQKTKGPTTQLSVDPQGKCEHSDVSEVEDIPLKFLILAGFALVLKAMAPTCTLDQCHQSVLTLAIKLKKQL